MDINAVYGLLEFAVRMGLFSVELKRELQGYFEKKVSGL